MKFIQRFIFLTVCFPQVNYAGWFLQCHDCYCVIVRRERGRMNTVVAPRTAVPSPRPLVLGCFWQLSWNVPACCFTKTAQLRVTAHCFFFPLAIICSLSPLLTFKDVSLNVSDLGEYICECASVCACVCVRAHDSGSLRVCSHCPLWKCVSLCLCTHRTGMWVNVWLCMCVFPSPSSVSVVHGSYLSRPGPCYCSGRQTELVWIRGEMSRQEILSSFFLLLHRLSRVLSLAGDKQTKSV